MKRKFFETKKVEIDERAALSCKRKTLYHDYFISINKTQHAVVKTSFHTKQNKKKNHKDQLKQERQGRNVAKAFICCAKEIMIIKTATFPEEKKLEEKNIKRKILTLLSFF